MHVLAAIGPGDRWVRRQRVLPRLRSLDDASAGTCGGGGGEEEDRALTDVSHEGAMATPLGVALMASKVLPTPG